MTGTGLENTGQKQNGKEQGMETITEVEEKNEEGLPEKEGNSGEIFAKEAIQTVEFLMEEPQTQEEGMGYCVGYPVESLRCFWNAR